MRHGKKGSLERHGSVVLGALLLLGLISACTVFNQLPIARISVDFLTGTSPLTVTFDGAGSEDPDGTIASYAWDFGDGATGSGITATHEYLVLSGVETFTVTLTVRDNGGNVAEATQSIEVHGSADGGTGGTGSPLAVFTVDRFIGVSPLTVTFDARSSLPGTGTIAAYQWHFGDEVDATGATVTHTYDPDETTEYRVTLMVWNSENDVATMQQNIIAIVPENDLGDEEPRAEITVTGPTLVYESDSWPEVPTLYEVSFDPRGSFADAGHSLDYYAWDFGDGQTRVETSDLEVTHIYELRSFGRTFVVQLTVFDDQGFEHTETANVTLVQP